MFNLFHHECNHEKFSIEQDIGYCPDCGELIENQWFLMRCSCCGIKHKAVVKNGKILPVEKFCHNCGAKTFIAERINKINFIDINYAVLVKKIIPPDRNEFTQSWVDDVRETSNCTQRLLQQFR